MPTLPDILAHPLVRDAYVLAVKTHSGQYRRDGKTPYIAHIQQVMLRTPDDPALLAVAALHDTAESDAAHPLTDDDLRAAGMPEVVIDGRRALTRGSESYEAHVRHIKTYMGGRFVPVKVADNLANLSDSPTRAQIVRYARSLLVLMED